MNCPLIRKVALDLGWPGPTLKRLARTAPYRYKKYEIPKRSGRGKRLIAQPAKEVKAVQRWLVANELTWMPLHEAATAYKKGASIRFNAQLHLRSKFLLKIDFANFFPSIEESHLRSHIERYALERYSPEEVEFLCRFLLWHPQAESSLALCIGAPSSPLISNSIMYDFDVAVSAHCLPLGIVYSRYADDLAFSTNSPNLLEGLTDFVRTQLRGLAYPRLSINETKTVFTSKKWHRSVTGLVLANQGYVSLGRERKRAISAMVYNFSQGILNGRQQRRLAGLLAFAKDVEPQFLQRLERRYSLELVERAREIGRDVRIDGDD